MAKDFNSVFGHSCFDGHRTLLQFQMADLERCAREKKQVDIELELTNFPLEKLWNLESLLAQQERASQIE